MFATKLLNPTQYPGQSTFCPTQLASKITFSTPSQKSCLEDISHDWTKEDVEETLAKAVAIYKKQEQ